MRRLAVPLVAVLALAGCGGSHHNKTPYKTLPRPPLPAGAKAPSCPPGNNHSMGECLPKQSGNTPPKLLRLPSGITCIDLSNNDPIYGVGAWRSIRAHGVRCAVFKVNESTGFVDRTAAAMASAAKASGVLVGGYDFQHVCLVSPTAEAHVFAANLRADGLLGPNTVTPTADVEYPISSIGCNGHSWEDAWRAQVSRETGRSAQTYTGDWWWSPHMGVYVPPGFKWVSGYGVSWPFIPRGWHLDVWQWTSSGAYGDQSLFLNGEGSFRAYTNSVSSLPVCFHKQESKAACSAVKAKIAGYQRAVSSSTGAYKARSCPVLAQRVAWFGNAIKTQPRSPKTASRKRALAASQRAYKAHSCGVFASRIGLYSNLIKQAQSSN